MWWGMSTGLPIAVIVIVLGRGFRAGELLRRRAGRVGLVQREERWWALVPK